MSGDVALTPKEAIGTTGNYVVFTVNSDATGLTDTVAAAADTFDMNSPILAAEMVAADPTPTDPTPTDPTPTDPEVTPADDPGDAGGGCSAGFSALALAVLGAFIARKK